MRGNNGKFFRLETAQKRSVLVRPLLLLFGKVGFLLLEDPLSHGLIPLQKLFLYGGHGGVVLSVARALEHGFVFVDGFLLGGAFEPELDFLEGCGGWRRVLGVEVL